MSQSIITKIKDGKITLPQEFQKEWSEGEVLVMRAPGGFFVKSITPPSISAIAKRIGKAAASARITAKDVTAAVAWARKQTYEGRT